MRVRPTKRGPPTRGGQSDAQAWCGSPSTVFETLGSPLCDPRVAARNIGRILKNVATQAIGRTSLEVVAEASILGLAKKVPISVAAAIVRVVASRELQLLPSHLTRVELVCDRLAVNQPPIIS
jgi:hypothetical protein